MKNKEKFAKEIIYLALHDETIAINQNGEPCICEYNCRKCILHGMRGKDNCHNCLEMWGDQEYVKRPNIDWSVIPVNTKVLVRQNDLDNWLKRYFAGVDEDKNPLVFIDGTDSWSNGELGTMHYKQIKLASDSSEN